MPSWYYFCRPSHSSFFDLRSNKQQPLPYTFTSLLGLGLKSCPTPWFATNKTTIDKTLERHQRDQWLRHFFKDDDTLV